MLGNQFNKINDLKKSSGSRAQLDRISLEDLKNLKQKAAEFEDIKKENESLKQKKSELSEKVDHLHEKNEKYLNRLQRLQADYENYKKRIDRTNEDYKLYATEKILRKLVAHYDDLKRTQKVIGALDIDEAVKKGFQMIVKNFENLLKEEGVELIESEGEKFDPYKHECMLVRENEEVPENTVLEELEKGYMFNKKVLRPAKVMVSRNSC